MNCPDCGCPDLTPVSQVEIQGTLRDVDRCEGCRCYIWQNEMSYSLQTWRDEDCPPWTRMLPFVRRYYDHSPEHVLCGDPEHHLVKLCDPCVELVAFDHQDWLQEAGRIGDFEDEHCNLCGRVDRYQPWPEEKVREVVNGNL